MIRVFTTFAALLLMAVSPLAAQENFEDLEPIVEVELDSETTLVGQPLTLRITLLVPSWFPQLPDKFITFEQPGLMVRLPNRATNPVNRDVDGEYWSGVSRVYKLYPLKPGRFTIPPATMKLVYANPGRTEPITRMAPFPAITFEAVTPTAARDLDPLIISDAFTLTQEIEGAADLAVGDAITRTLTASISGTTAVLIPKLTPDIDPGILRAYPKDPTVTETEEDRVLSGTRQEVTTYLAQDGGSVALPPVNIDWFNYKSGKIETVSVPGVDVTITGSAPEPKREIDTATVIRWVIVAMVLLVVGWLAKKYLVPPLQIWIVRTKADWQASEQAAHGRVQKAIMHRDLSAALSSFEAWLQFFPDAGTEADEMRDALSQIGRAQYGTTTSNPKWAGVGIAYAKTRRRLRKMAKPVSPDQELPPLNP